MSKEEILKIFKKYIARTNYSNAIYEGSFDNIINKILTLHKLENAELKAKVYTYEKIIANSNFRTILDIPPMEITCDLGGEDNE